MNYTSMGKHSEWRKLAKKARRKRIRRDAALLREKAELEEQKQKENSPTYIKRKLEQEQLEAFQLAQQLQRSQEQEQLYQEREKIAQKQWQEVQKKIEEAREKRATQNAKIRQEWEAHQKKLKEEKEQKEKQAEEKKLQQERLQLQIEDFLNNDAEMPCELLELVHTNPGREQCPFFSKTSACRFGDMCSRDHIRPTISKILVFRNFYSHYSLDMKENEHGDSSLEFESNEMNDHFTEFFNDVIPELEKHGVVDQFKVCCNKEAHLRGNVYVEYSSCKEAIRSFRRFSGRYYAGKRINVEFCKIDSWKSAVCGLFYRRRCPKGSVCNFLHIFRNPGNSYTKIEKSIRHTPKSQRSAVKDFDDGCGGSERSNWRWSESPESTSTKNSSCNEDKPDIKASRKRRRSRSRSKKRSRTEKRSSSNRREKKMEHKNKHERSRSNTNRSKHKKRKRSRSK